jgi:hypothetical protein
LRYAGTCDFLWTKAESFFLIGNANCFDCVADDLFALLKQFFNTFASTLEDLEGVMHYSTTEKFGH